MSSYDSALNALSERFDVSRKDLETMWDQQIEHTRKKLEERGGLIEGSEHLMKKFGTKELFHCLQLDALINNLEARQNTKDVLCKSTN